MWSPSAAAAIAAWMDWPGLTMIVSALRPAVVRVSARAAAAAWRRTKDVWVMRGLRCRRAVGARGGWAARPHNQHRGKAITWGTCGPV